VAEEIEGSMSTRALAVPTDVKVEESVVNLVELTVQEFGRIDVLVNNAGGTRMGPLESAPTKAWDSVFALNVRGPFLCTREGTPPDRPSVGRDRQRLLGCRGVNGVRQGAGYRAAKAAL
jgi:NAD(P)-dependent dehydrogenase (short-subunit alcohol dehydrogenase family)